MRALKSRHFWLLLFPSHLFVCLGILLVLLSSPPMRLFFYFLVGWLLIGGYGIAVGYHRLLSHRSFVPRKGFAPFLYLLGALGGQGSPLLWAVFHRTHHLFSDQDNDVHSPRKGWLFSYISWQFQLKPGDVRLVYVRDLIGNRWLSWLHNHYELIVWSLIFLVALLNWELALFGTLFPMVLSTHLDNLVNVVCHFPRFGYRNFQTKDQSVNNFILGWLNFGGGWHNNHHARPQLYDFGGQRWFEFDVCRLLVPIVKTSKRTLPDLGTTSP